MDSSHALIVDDSRTAQLRLKRMLEVYDLEIDVAASAEEALSYLSYRAPAVIFLDESMQGMNGIDALRTIKLNPGTATIPVIMYTSEQGEVFTSQARALGALDILDKGRMASSNLDTMLQRLKIRQRRASNDVQRPAGATPRPAARNPAVPRSEDPNYVRRLEFTQLQQQVARLFEIHIANVNRQISKSTQFVVKRFHAHADQAAKTPTEVVVGNVPLDTVIEDIKADRRRSARFTNMLLGIALVALVTLGLIVTSLFDQIRVLQAQNSEVVAAVDNYAQRLDELSAPVSRPRVTAPAGIVVGKEVIDTLGWLSSEHFSFDVNEQPLGENMIPRLQELIGRLSSIGYQGAVGININFGNVCYAPSSTGDVEIAPGSMRVIDCILRATTEPAPTSESYQTLAFANFLQSAPVLREQNITLAVNSVSFDNPRFPYPPVGDESVAADWNHAAAKNNYLSFVFEAAGAAQ